MKQITRWKKTTSGSVTTWKTKDGRWIEMKPMPLGFSAQLANWLITDNYRFTTASNKTEALEHVKRFKKTSKPIKIPSWLRNMEK